MVLYCEECGITAGDDRPTFYYTESVLVSVDEEGESIDSDTQDSTETVCSRCNSRANRIPDQLSGIYYEFADFLAELDEEDADNFQQEFFRLLETGRRASFPAAVLREIDKFMRSVMAGKPVAGKKPVKGWL